MPEPLSPWELADDVCDRLLKELRFAAETVLKAAVEAAMPINEAASLMECLAKAERGIQDAKDGIGEWIERKQDVAQTQEVAPHPLSPPHKPREKVSDLIEAGLLEVGEVLAFQRGDTTYEAIVHIDGRLEIGRGGVFDSPSRAAAEAAGSKSEPGWDVWQCPNGKTLADLRWELRAASFPHDSGKHGDKYMAEKRNVVTRWVSYALSEGLHPGKRDDSAVQQFLGANRYAEATLNSYHRHLDEWFSLWNA